MGHAVIKERVIGVIGYVCCAVLSTNYRGGSISGLIRWRDVVAAACTFYLRFYVKTSVYYTTHTQACWRYRRARHRPRASL